MKTTQMTWLLSTKGGQSPLTTPEETDSPPVPQKPDPEKGSQSPHDNRK